MTVDSLRGADPSSRQVPLLLHVDVNKTIIISDAIMGKSTEYTIREVISSQFYGQVTPGSQPIWEWDGQGPSSEPTPIRSGPLVSASSAPRIETEASDDGRHSVSDEKVSYMEFLRRTMTDKGAMRLAARSFERVDNPECKQLMTGLAERASEIMTIPAPQRTSELQEQTGLEGEWRLLFPSFFRFVSGLQRQRRQFSVCFRTFGADLTQVRMEWNAFCEMRHPLYNEYLEDIGPMDGTVPGVPDRRMGEQDVSTMYRDEYGPCVAVGVQTNGQWEGQWDQWGKSRDEADTRGGRAFFKDCGLTVVEGYAAVQSWFKSRLAHSKTHLMREDFAWWHHNGEVSTAGKPLIGIGGVQQVFFDDNIGRRALKIVDPRFADTLLPALPEQCFRADPLQAMLSETWFADVFAEAARNVDALWRDTGPRERHTGAARGEDDLCEEGAERDGAPTVVDADGLRHLPASSGVDVGRLGSPGTAHEPAERLRRELSERDPKRSCIHTLSGPDQ